MKRNVKQETEAIQQTSLAVKDLFLRPKVVNLFRQLESGDEMP